MAKEPIDLCECGEQIEAEIAAEEAKADETVAEVDEITGTESWLTCPPWNGEESSLPAGEQTRIPNFQAADLVRAWEVLDASEDEGYRAVKRSRLQDGDIIIGAQINENSVDRVKATYGPRFAVFRPADGSKFLTREEWRAARKTDVLELQALKEIRQKMSGGGVHARPVR